MNPFASMPIRWIDKSLPLCLLLPFLASCPDVPPIGGGSPPVADAGKNQAVIAGASVKLDGSASSDPDGNALSFSWKQTLGPAVTLSSATSAVATFSAPDKNAVLSFKLTVNDGQSDSSASTGVAVQLTDPSAQVEERVQRSVTEDPAAMGNFPNDWLISGAGAGLPGPPADDSNGIDEPELPEFVELFRNTRAPQIVQENLEPGATRTVSLDIAGASGLAALTQWIGTVSPLSVAIALDGSNLSTTATSYQMGTDRGGSYLRTLTTAGGTASISVTNTTGVTVQIRIVFIATALSGE